MMPQVNNFKIRDHDGLAAKASESKGWISHQGVVKVCIWFPAVDVSEWTGVLTDVFQDN